MNCSSLLNSDGFGLLLAQAGNNVLMNAGIFLVLAAGAVFAVCRSSRRN